MISNKISLKLESPLLYIKERKKKKIGLVANEIKLYFSNLYSVRGGRYFTVPLTRRQ